MKKNWENVTSPNLLNLLNNARYDILGSLSGTPHV